MIHAHHQQPDTGILFVHDHDKHHEYARRGQQERFIPTADGDGHEHGAVETGSFKIGAALTASDLLDLVLDGGAG